MTLAQLESEVFSLSIQERAALARRILLSLEELSEPEHDRLWGSESARRAAELDADDVKAIPGEEVAKKARALLQ